MVSHTFLIFLKEVRVATPLCDRRLNNYEMSGFPDHGLSNQNYLLAISAIGYPLLHYELF
jgi:hypothetical protein